MVSHPSQGKPANAIGIPVLTFNGTRQSDPLDIIPSGVGHWGKPYNVNPGLINPWLFNRGLSPFRIQTTFGGNTPLMGRALLRSWVNIIQLILGPFASDFLGPRLAR